MGGLGMGVRMVVLVGCPEVHIPFRIDRLTFYT
jgi:hypothetical protein